MGFEVVGEQVEASRSASCSVKNDASSRSKNDSARSSPSTERTACRIELSLAG
ncbi:hypothetical protein [Nonomuraea longispora]|uniref:hypothetical protein n=1 Tax=Nonomuraea longispora TaxID=1848320 RepID=UPI00140546CE|nr:hypothetical protein [Nonomuraea longispora]